MPDDDVLARPRGWCILFILIFVAREAGKLLLGLIDDPQGVQVPISRTFPAAFATLPTLRPGRITLLSCCQQHTCGLRFAINKRRFMSQVRCERGEVGACARQACTWRLKGGGDGVVCPLTFMRLVRQAKQPGEGFPVLTISTGRRLSVWFSRCQSSVSERVSKFK